MTSAKPHMRDGSGYDSVIKCHWRRYTSQFGREVDQNPRLQ